MLVTLAAVAASTASLSIAPPMASAKQQPTTSQADDSGPLMRHQEVRSLPGGLDQVLMLNDNNPELISGREFWCPPSPRALGSIWP